MKFTLLDLCQLLYLSDVGDPFSFDDLPAYGKTESKVYSAIFLNGGKPKLQPN